MAVDGVIVGRNLALRHVMISTGSCPTTTYVAGDGCAGVPTKQAEANHPRGFSSPLDGAIDRHHNDQIAVSL